MVKEGIFGELTFSDIFETFDDEYLTLMAAEKPEQLKKMCLFLTLDEQIRMEKMVETPEEKMN